MAEQLGDRFRRYYAEKLWELIPPIYRHEDGSAAQPGVLRALVEVLADQAAILRRSTDRLWEDQVIDFCDDWAVPYLADLVGTRLVSAFDKRARRADVANTIYYRRRAGTLVVLEGLVTDITGWQGTAIEEFRRLARHPHGLDPAPAQPGRFTATPAHALPDLRRPRGAELAWSAWDEWSHLPDVRRSRGGLDGRYGVTKIAFHLYRLPAYPIVRAQPRALAPDSGGRVRVSFDPSGRAIPLFQRSNRVALAADWRAAREWELPAPLRCQVLADAAFVITEASILRWLGAGAISAGQADELRSLRGLRFASEQRLRLRLRVTLSTPLSLAAMRGVLRDALVGDCGKAMLLPAPASDGSGDSWSIQIEEPLAGVLTPIARELTIAANLTGALPNTTDKRLVIDADNGMGYFSAGTPPAGIRASYYYGFSGEIGAGSYARPGLPLIAADGQRSGGGPIAAVASPDAQIEIRDSLSYGPIADMTVQHTLRLQSASQQRPYLELAGDWTLTAAQPACSLALDGLWLSGAGPRTIRLAAVGDGSWQQVTLAHLSLDPGGATLDNTPIGPMTLAIESPVEELFIEASVVGRITVAAAGAVERMHVRSSIVHSTDLVNHPVALQQARGELDIQGSTVIGGLQAQRLEASELLCTGRIETQDVQAGCIRFSAFPPDSLVPRAYRTQPLDDARSLFTSQRFGDPGYAQLSASAPDAIARGGDGGREIGAFNALDNPLKFDSLRAKVDEFLPFGLTPLYLTEI